MKLKNILIVVKNIERSKEFYHKLFGLDVILNSDGNVIMTEGLVLQDEKIWSECIGKDIVSCNNKFELYFEENNIEKFSDKLERFYPETKYLSRITVYPNGKKIMRFYDPDDNIIEVGTP